MEKESIPQELITYITLLSAMQVVQNCALELQGTGYDQGKVKIKVREAIIAMTNANDKRKRQMWENDSLMSATFMKGIQTIGEQLGIGIFQSDIGLSIQCHHEHVGSWFVVRETPLSH